jgi:hypothetical protein
MYINKVRLLLPFLTPLPLKNSENSFKHMYVHIEFLMHSLTTYIKLGCSEINVSKTREKQTKWKWQCQVTKPPEKMKHHIIKKSKDIANIPHKNCTYIADHTLYVNVCRYNPERRLTLICCVCTGTHQDCCTYVSTKYSRSRKLFLRCSRMTFYLLANSFNLYLFQTKWTLDLGDFD